MKRKDFEKFINSNYSLFGNKCAQCGKKMQKYDDPRDWEFMKTKSTYIFVCADCIKGEKNEPTKP